MKSIDEIISLALKNKSYQNKYLENKNSHEKYSLVEELLKEEHAPNVFYSFGGGMAFFVYQNKIFMRRLCCSRNILYREWLSCKIKTIAKNKTEEGRIREYMSDLFIGAVSPDEFEFSKEMDYPTSQI